MTKLKLQLRCSLYNLIDWLFLKGIIDNEEVNRRREIFNVCEWGDKELGEFLDKVEKIKGGK